MNYCALYFPRLRAWASLKHGDAARAGRGIADFPRLRAWASLKQMLASFVHNDGAEFPTPSGVGLIEATFAPSSKRDVPRISHAFGRGPH